MPGLLVVTPPGPEADALRVSLMEHGFQVTLSPNGAAAVESAAKVEPDVILMDPSLSAMDRWHAVKRLNADIGTSRIPVLTLASDASSPAGMQRVLGKIERTMGSLPTPKPRATPARPERRTGTARLSEPPAGERASGPRPRLKTTPGMPPRRSQPPAAVLAAPPAAPPPATAPAPSAGTPPMPPPRERQEKARLLVVDDNALNRDMLSRRLERRNYDVAVADDGVQALRMLEAERFDLVLLDWMMPGMSGIEVLQKVRATRSPVQLPIVMATAKTEAEDVVEALKAGANDYVTKPLNFDVVHARIRTQLHLVRAHRDLEASERRFKALLENTGDMILQFTPSGVVHYVSPACRALLGFEAESLKQRSFYDWMHPIDRRELLEQQRDRGRLPRNFTFLARMQRSDGTYTWIETSARVLGDEQGGEPLVQAACRDVSEHMQRITGDEPPLPLGGDIMDHPGWRSGSLSPAVERSAAPGTPAAPPPAAPVTQVVLVSQIDGDVASMSRDELLQRLAVLLAPPKH